MINNILLKKKTILGKEFIFVNELELSFIKEGL
jgi:hypothetical protein